MIYFDKSHLYLSTMLVHDQIICIQKHLQLINYYMAPDFPFLTKEREVWGPPRAAGVTQT